MSFSTVFKQLRRSGNFTQEDIAEALGVTPQAVSRWECGSALPDLSLFPKITYLFGVTADYLLEIDNSRAEARVEEIIRSTYAANNRGDKAEVLRLYREGLREFPRNEKLMENLAAEIFVSFGGLDEAQRRKNYEEACELCGFLLEHSTDTERRFSATSLYIYLLRYGEEWGYDENARAKAMRLMETLPSKYSCREEMQMTFMTREEAFEARKRQAYDFFFHDLPYYILYMNENPDYTLDEQIAAFEQIRCLFDAAMPDDEIYSRSWHNSMFYETGAELYRRKGDAEKMFGCLRIQKDEVIRCDVNRYSEDETAGTFTLKSPLFKGITAQKGHVATSRKESFSRGMYQCLTGEAYAEFRGNPELEKILAELETSAKQYE